MSNTTWHRVEDAKSVRDTTYVRVDKVLDWPRDSCRQILDDPDYEPFPSESTATAQYSTPPLSEAAVKAAIQNATIATLPDLTGAQILALQNEAVEELKRQGLLGESG